MKQAMKTWEGCFEHANTCLQVCRSTQQLMSSLFNIIPIVHRVSRSNNLQLLVCWFKLMEGPNLFIVKVARGLRSDVNKVGALGARIKVFSLSIASPSFLEEAPTTAFPAPMSSYPRQHRSLASSWRVPGLQVSCWPVLDTG